MKITFILIFWAAAMSAPRFASANDCWIQSGNFTPKPGEEFEIKWKTSAPQVLLHAYQEEKPDALRMLGTDAKKFKIMEPGWYNFSLERADNKSWQAGTCNAIVQVGFKPVENGGSLDVAKIVAHENLRGFAEGFLAKVTLKLKRSGKKCSELGAFTVTKDFHSFDKLRSLNKSALVVNEGPPGTVAQDGPAGEHLLEGGKDLCIVEFEESFPRGSVGAQPIYVYRGYERWVGAGPDLKGVDIVASALAIVPGYPGDSEQEVLPSDSVSLQQKGSALLVSPEKKTPAEPACQKMAKTKTLATVVVEFQYPEGALDCEPTGGGIICRAAGEARGEFSIFASNKVTDPKLESLEQYKKKFLERPVLRDPSTNSAMPEDEYEKQITIAGHAWEEILRKNTELPGFYSRYFATQTRGYEAIIYFNVKAGEYEKYRCLMKNVLETFRSFSPPVF